MKQRTVTVTEFRAKASALLDEVQKHGGSITITRRGKAVAEINRPVKRPFRSSRGILAGKSNLPTDIIDTTHLWNALRGEGLDY